jgi:ribosomal-protein-alanine N-acetyltransferase
VFRNFSFLQKTFPFLIRKEKKEDLSPSFFQEIVSLDREVFSDPWSVVTWERTFKNPRSSFFTAHLGETLVGYLVAVTVLSVGEIHTLGVHPIYRRKKIATHLWHAFLSDFRQEGGEVVFLEVRKSNFPAIAFYKKMGFTLVGERKNYYYAPKEDAFLFRFIVHKRTEGGNDFS